jgi:predicted ATP-grasp superfamily ATP-dependent carboligase
VEGETAAVVECLLGRVGFVGIDMFFA